MSKLCDFKDLESFKPHEALRFRELCAMYMKNRECFFRKIDWQPDFVTCEFPLEVAQQLWNAQKLETEISKQE
jgi:hypothetical protein